MVKCFSIYSTLWILFCFVWICWTAAGCLRLQISQLCLLTIRPLKSFFFFLGLQNDLHTNKFDRLRDWVGTPVAPCLSLSFSKLTNKKFTVPLTPIREWNIALREEDDQSKLKGTVLFYSTAYPRFIWRKKSNNNNKKPKLLRWNRNRKSFTYLLWCRWYTICIKG